MINEVGYFRPVDSWGKILTGNLLGKIHGYAYEDISNDMVVAKCSGYPESYSVGNLPSIVAVLSARKLLDSLGFHQNRMINIAIVSQSDRVNGSKIYDPKAITSFNSLAHQFGIPVDYRDQTGITLMDSRNPLFYSRNFQEWIDHDEFCATLLFAERFIHEFTHIQQMRLSLPVYSSWAEIGAMSAGGRFLLPILNSGRLNRKQESIILTLVKDKARKVFDYRNGRNFDSHLRSPNSNIYGSPVKDQTLHTEDFQFGY
jgi:hypothetical protein